MVDVSAELWEWGHAIFLAQSFEINNLGCRLAAMVLGLLSERASFAEAQQRLLGEMSAF
jgi:hypothetical protein